MSPLPSIRIMRGYWSIAALAVFLIGIVAAQDCAWNKDTDFPASFQPLLLDKSSWLSLKPVLENGLRIVKETEGAAIVVACPGNTIATLGVEVAEGTCSQGKIRIGTQSYTVIDLVCTKTVTDSTLHGLGSCGSSNQGVTAQLGFTIVGYPFYPLIEVCFEDTFDIAIYTKHIVYGKYVSAADPNTSRPSFKTDSTLYSFTNPNNCYGTTAQDDYVTSVTGDANIIDLNSNNYFSRGHLSPNVDFLIEMEADATFYYTNAVPQWQLYNGGNWQYLEANVRTLAGNHQSDLEITTGPWELLTFKNSNGVTTDAYLCDDMSFHVIPVPLSTWKVVYDPDVNQGVVIITSNVPNQTTAPTPICPVINCSTITWLMTGAFDPLNFAKGYTYCCTVQDFHSVNPNAPSYSSAGLLVN